MKNKILSFLKNSDNFISGEEISKLLNISRNAVWKHINTLKLEGYEIHSIRNKGYKLLNEPNIITKGTLLPLLKTKSIGRNLITFKDIDSTNIYAKELCKKSIIHGTAIVSETQTSGHGRFNRYWVSPLGGIWNSLILTPNIDPIDASKITLIAAAAMHKTLADLNIKTQIKWPNDLYLNNKKICGILTTMNSDMDKINYLVLGLGLNVNIDEDYFIKNDLSTGTSLKIQLNKSFNLALILSNFYNNFELMYEDFIKTLDLTLVVSTFKENSMFLNKKAFLVNINKREEVLILDINNNGELIVKDSLGNIKPVLSGEITFKNL